MQNEFDAATCAYVCSYSDGDLHWHFGWEGRTILLGVSFPLSEAAEDVFIHTDTTAEIFDGALYRKKFDEERWVFRHGGIVGEMDCISVELAVQWIAEVDPAGNRPVRGTARLYRNEGVALEWKKAMEMPTMTPKTVWINALKSLINHIEEM